MPPTKSPVMSISRIALLLLAPATLALPAHAAEGLALKRVLLSTGGVGYFEHEATVNGGATLELEVRRDQVDDVLKSIVVYDDAGGIGTIGLPGEEPLEAVFRELPFAADDLASPADLLRRLKGAEVRVGGARELEGRLMAVTEETAALPGDGGTITRHRVTLATPNGLAQFVLEETNTLSFADATVQAQVDRALEALGRHRGQGRRTLSIRTSGTGTRTVRVAYVVAAPLWKATYRLTLRGSDTRTADVQGWAVLENVSGQDWSGVDLTVVSGNPVTFRQDLYAAYFIDRPTVPVEVQGRVLPAPDAGSVAATGAVVGAMIGAGKRPEAFDAAPMPAPQAMARALPAAPPRAAEPLAADATEAATQVVFRYPQPVTLANGGSLLMPIVARAVPAERLALFQPGTQPRHPLASVRLANETGSGLPPGVVTLYERDSASGAVSYVGDARLAGLPAGESRLLSFAVDRKVAIDRDEQPGRALTTATIADGMLQLAVTERQTTVYTIAGAAQEPRTVVLEHPRRSGWSLVEPKADSVEVTPDAIRLPVTVAAGGTVSRRVTVERPRLERLALADLAPERVHAYASSAEVPKPVRDALGQLATLRAREADAARQVTALTQERETVAADQARLRANLESLPADSDLHRRTLARMGEAETRLETLGTAIATAREEADAAARAVTEFVRGLRL